MRVRPKPIKCSECDKIMVVRETHGPARRRICENGHIKHTIGSKVVEKELYYQAEFAHRRKRAIPTKVRTPEPVIPKPEPEPPVKLSTGHIVTKTATGYVYKMEWVSPDDDSSNSPDAASDSTGEVLHAVDRAAVERS